MKRAALLLLATSIAWGVNCGGTSIGFTPFTNPYAPAYKGQAVSLYPNSNQRPITHEALGLQQAAQIVPRDTAGNPDPNGRIVLLSIGLSNTTQEFSASMQLAMRDPKRNPSVLLVDGAFGGWTAAMIAAQPDQYWSMVNDRLRAANVTASQVQAAWLKLADANPTAVFPNDALQLQAEEATVVTQTR